MLLTVHNLLDDQGLDLVEKALNAAEFHDGRETAGAQASRVKHNEQIRRDDPAVADAARLILAALSKHDSIARFVLPRQIMVPMFNRYAAGMSYGDHVDNALMPGQPMTRSDMSVTIFLSDPDSYEGGELVVNSDLGAQAIKLPRGSAVLYPSTTQHRVNEVTSGVRLAAVTWVQSLVRDIAQRQILAELGALRQSLSKSLPDSPEGLLAQKVRSNLLRMWMDD